MKIMIFKCSWTKEVFISIIFHFFYIYEPAHEKRVFITQPNIEVSGETARMRNLHCSHTHYLELEEASKNHITGPIE